MTRGGPGRTDGDGVDLSYPECTTSAFPGSKDLLKKHRPGSLG